MRRQLAVIVTKDSLVNLLKVYYYHYIITMKFHETAKFLLLLMTVKSEALIIFKDLCTINREKMSLLCLEQQRK